MDFDIKMYKATKHVSSTKLYKLPGGNIITIGSEYFHVPDDDEFNILER